MDTSFGPQLYEDIQTFAAGVRAFIATDPNKIGPATGFYWWIPYISIYDTDGAQQTIGVFLVAQPGYPATVPPTAAGPFPGNPTAGLPGWIRVAPISANIGTSDFSNVTSQAGGHAGVLFKRAIVIPSMCQLVAVEENAAISASQRQIGWRFAYQQIKNGCAPPKVF